jgi:hypothetical protein
MKNNTIAQFYTVDITPLAELKEKHPYPEYHPASVNVCTELMEVLVALAEQNPNELLYVCEDDYLHTTQAIVSMKKLFELGYDGFYVPYDYPDRYTIDKDKIVQLVAGPYNHLRTVPSATLTIAAKGSTWLRYKYDVLRAGVFSDDSWTWKAFAQTNAYCPVPGQATHLQNNCITPYIDWLAVYDNVNIEEN